MGADDGRRFYSTLMGPTLFDGNASVFFLMEVHPYYICPARAYVHIPVELQLPARSDAGWMMRDAPALELSTRDAESLAAAHAHRSWTIWAEDLQHEANLYWAGTQTSNGNSDSDTDEDVPDLQLDSDSDTDEDVPDLQLTDDSDSDDDMPGLEIPVAQAA